VLCANSALRTKGYSLTLNVRQTDQGLDLLAGAIDERQLRPPFVHLPAKPKVVRLATLARVN
jgi:hypothetical protein